MAKRAMGFYRSYSFKTKDPVIDRLRTAVQDSKLSYRDIHESEGISVSTLSNWFGGKTRRPQFCTVMAVFRACGVDLKETPYSLRKNGGK
jgi:transcriptional regulator with XRE-family HTH domain